MKKRLSIIFFCILSLFALISCGKKEQKQIYYTVNFVTNCDTKIDYQKVLENEKIKEPIAPTKEGYSFNGWICNNKKWDFNNAVTSNMTLKADWSVNKYKITIKGLDSNYTIEGITNGDQYEYNSTIKLISKNIPEGNTIRWNRNDGITEYGLNYSFSVPANELEIEATMIARPYNREGSKIYFGRYPQTLVDNSDLISELDVLAGSLPDSENLYNWTDYNYYIEYKVESYMYYQDIDKDNDGEYDYRGVYFTNYRPYDYSLNPSKEYFGTGSTKNSYQYVNGYRINNVYWFKYDLIEWDVLDDSNGKALLMSNLILDSQEFYPSGTSATFEHNGGTGYGNNYKLSKIRKFLNNDFYNLAFNDIQKEMIEISNVDNSALTTSGDHYSSNTISTKNPFACDNTNDKLYVLSYKEAYNYKFNNKTYKNVTTGTDYAKVQGLYVDSDYNSRSSWWLRSPYYNSNFTDNGYRTDIVNPSGLIGTEVLLFSTGRDRDGRVYNASIGVRPVCLIKSF